MTRQRTCVQRGISRFAFTIALATIGACARGEPSPLGTPDEREALVRDLVRQTLERTAWSPYTEGRPEQTFERDALALIPEFRAADTDHALLLALIRLSNLRHDRHLSVEPVAGGLQPPPIDAMAPIQFRTHFAVPGRYTLFVADYDRTLGERAGDRPAVGDVLVAVDDVAIDEYARRLEPYLRYSTLDKRWWETAIAVSLKSWRFGPELYAPGDSVRYRLQHADGSQYTLAVEHQPADGIQWAGHSTKRYPDFTRILTTASFDAYVHARGKPLVILDYHRFEPSGPADIDSLMSIASKRGLLDHAVFVDGTTSGGGSRGAYVLARLSPRPFKTTFGNLRLSDVTDRFIREVKREHDEGGAAELSDGGGRLVEWLTTDVVAALERRDAYSAAVPFKLAELPKDSDGTMSPARLHFRGGLAAAFSPFGGSHLDQFAATVIDNDLGYTLGMSAGGYSNTWEWTDTLRLPGSGRPLATFMWNIGHTIRPNGEILEGNAAPVQDRIPLTRENYSTYHADLIARVLAHFDSTKRE
ncbi:MAG: hypothetical protein ACREMQ_04915 [Longimicrobiales bacterium]